MCARADGRKVMVLINPAGGKGHAQRVFDNECRQLLLRAALPLDIRGVLLLSRSLAPSPSLSVCVPLIVFVYAPQ